MCDGGFRGEEPGSRFAGYDVIIRLRCSFLDIGREGTGALCFYCLNGHGAGVLNMSFWADIWRTRYLFGFLICYTH